jgi:hypothetical protein
MINYQVAGSEETVLHFGTIVVHILRDLGIHHTSRTPQQEEMIAQSDG